MAVNCRRVPRYPARNFEEAIQSVFICFQFLPDSLGLPDRYLLPFYRNGLESGTLTRDHAKELLQELFIMINGWTPLTSSNWDKGGESHFVIGGYNERHKDNYNELSELILEAMMEMPLYRPQVSFRWTPETPHEVMRKIMDYERKDQFKRMAFVNDVPRIAANMKIRGMNYEQACNYIMVGCNEPTFPGALVLCGENVNIVRCLTRTLLELTPEIVECQSFDEFYAVFERELERDVIQAMEYNNMFNAIRSRDINVISSIFIDGCIEHGLSATQRGFNKGGTGLIFSGQICLIDSLAVIRQFVYDEKLVSQEKLCEALSSNWTDTEDLRSRILKTGRFFGNHDELSDGIAQRLNDSLFRIAHGRKDYFGLDHVFGNLAGYVPHYVFFGNNTAATPDGRHAGDPFHVGSGQYDGKDKSGITSLLASVATMDPSGIMSGSSVFNLLVDEAMIKNDEVFDKTVNLIETYFRMGGMHVQLNHVSREELLQAKEEPDKHRSLRVRVSGFSANFVTLEESIQDDVIHRTGQNV